MQNLKIITKITLLFCGIVLMLTILDFAALTDIWKDYVSPQIIDRYSLANFVTLPDWTSTTGEWSLVKISFYSRLLFFIFLIIAQIYIFRKITSTNKVSEK